MVARREAPGQYEQRAFRRGTAERAMKAENIAEALGGRKSGGTWMRANPG
jgi:hypothetical protein